jgi:hypothetical protein
MTGISENVAATLMASRPNAAPVTPYAPKTPSFCDVTTYISWIDSKIKDAEMEIIDMQQDVDKMKKRRNAAEKSIIENAQEQFLHRLNRPSRI